MNGQAPRRPRLRALSRWTTLLLAVIGALAIVITAVGATLDFREFDQTSGGYDPPYEGWTGTPIDWSEGAVSSTGFVRVGRVLHTELNCASGMLSFNVLGNSIDYRVVSPRAIKVHKPREACAAAGFEPEF